MRRRRRRFAGCQLIFMRFLSMMRIYAAGFSFSGDFLD